MEQGVGINYGVRTSALRRERRMDDRAQLERIREKLARAKEHDRACARFGASRHQYRLGQPIALNSIAEFETATGERLPVGFRLFISELGNGGAGPAWGWPPFEPEARWYREVSWRQPFTPATDDEPSGCITLYEHGCGIYDFLVVTGPERGNVWFSDDCCDLYPLPGREWNSLQGLSGPLASVDWRRRLANPTNRSRITFLDHYESWLDEVLSGS